MFNRKSTEEEGWQKTPKTSCFANIWRQPGRARFTPVITLLKSFLPDAGLDGKMARLFYLHFQPVGTQRHLISKWKRSARFRAQNNPGEIQGDRKTGSTRPTEAVGWAWPRPTSLGHSGGSMNYKNSQFLLLQLHVHGESHPTLSNPACAPSPPQPRGNT